ncbi:lipocalin family protein [Flavobacterium sp. SUN052]|uniref:lipocalin family protein n=1 Tax=Flavobacterium sp. SUN052 TaxID=3002441 RepID=UPI00237DC65F|nr:lipocalin family protein [Flavobacterium sp. SUN052]MEC4005785.1 lipocalin family protein [Flavobacterium sp. SUN052]
MKNIKFSLLLLLASVFFISCENEPLDPVLTAQINANTGTPGGSTGGGSTGGGITPTNIEGTYKLTTFNTSVPTDLNGDGVNSTNQMNETVCFNNTFITLNADHTFTADNKGIDIDTTVTPNVLTCFSDPATTGTWVLNGNVLTTTYVESGVTYTDNVNVVGSTLQSTIQAGDVIATATVNGVPTPVTIISDITIIYTKQ